MTDLHRPGLKVGSRTEFCVRDARASRPYHQGLVPGAWGASGQLSFSPTYPEPTVKQVWKALALQKALQQVLETPGAAEALQQPALKPLLDMAAD
jgi:hypothetical protein